jgi:hypothetical protein
MPPRALTAALALLALAAALAACQETEEEPPPGATATGPPAADASAPATQTVGPKATPAPRTPGPGETLYRWGNVTVIVPRDVGVSVTRLTAFGTDDRPAVRIGRGDSVLVIDALTGALVERIVADTDRDGMENIRDTIEVTTSLALGSLPWPYGQAQPVDSKLHRGNLLYWEPHPGSGLVVSFLARQFENGADEVLVIENLRSQRFVSVETGAVIHSNDRIDQEDLAAFERWTQAIEVVAQ